MKYVEIAVRYRARDQVLTYSYDDLDLEVGDLVEVPLARRFEKGCVLRFVDTIDQKYKVKNVKSVISKEFQLSDKELKLYEWMSKYYHYNQGLLIFDCLPKILKRPHKIDFVMGQGKELIISTNHIQESIVQKILATSFESFNRFLIHGVTGSGKTLIYIKLMKEVIAKGKSVLFLLPEINLTPQFTKEMAEFLDCNILPYHSEITNSEKNTVWKYLKKGDSPSVIVGVRSSVFLPIENLGLIIVDEEHDGSFKQSDRCLYNARDVAIKKAQLSNCPIVMGSATPSLENFHAFKDKENQFYFKMPNRVEGGGNPEIQLIDIRDKTIFAENAWPLDLRSIEEIKKSLGKGEQVLVFINRLGFSNFLQCRSCGHTFKDPNTGVNLRYFKKRHVLSSPHSDYECSVPDVCPECSNMNLLEKGFGTEKVAEVLSTLFPDKKIGRFDRDEIKNFEQLNNVLQDFHAGNTNILVGTQMLSKGHNFKRVNLVVILGVDSGLNFPDFRAIEKTYQTLTQVLGRAGRFSKESKVLIQTLTPEMEVFQMIKKHSFDGFYDFELSMRKMTAFPPFSRMALILVHGKSRDHIIQRTLEVVNSLNVLTKSQNMNVEILGPTPMSVEMKNGKFTWKIALLSSDVNSLHFCINAFEKNWKPQTSLEFKIDVDPYGNS